MTIAEGNRLILDYMNSDEDLSTCSYHGSMDELMPVVYKMVKDGHEFNITICKLKVGCSVVNGNNTVEYTDPHLGTDVWKCITDILSQK